MTPRLYATTAEGSGKDLARFGEAVAGCDFWGKAPRNWISRGRFPTREGERAR